MNTSRSYRVKRTLKPIIVCVLGTIVAAIPGTLFYLLWSWLCAQIPTTYAYAWAIKMGVTAAMVLFGGGATIMVTLALSVACLAIAVAILE